MARGVPQAPRWAWIAMVAGLLVIGALVAFGPSHPKDPVSAEQAQRMAAGVAASSSFAKAVSTHEAVAFMGDSYTGGSEMGGTGATGWPALLRNQEGWVFAGQGNFGYGGTGYLNPGPGGKDGPLGSHVAAVIAAKPSVVIVAAGINDGYYPLRQVTAAASDVLTRLHKGLPKSRIVVVGPFYPHSPPPAYITDERDGIFAAAKSLGITDLIDPGPWFEGPDAVQIGADGTHPTDRGHEQIAQHMVAALSRFGISPPPR